jgi:hypothetical protein
LVDVLSEPVGSAAVLTLGDAVGVAHVASFRHTADVPAGPSGSSADDSDDGRAPAATHYESLLDPLDSWLKRLVFHEYNEIHLYWSMLQKEEDRRIRSIWELHLGMEIGRLHAAGDLLRRYEGLDPEQILPKELPDTPVSFDPNKEYVREILTSRLDLRANGVDYVTDAELPADHRSRRYATS